MRSLRIQLIGAFALVVVISMSTVAFLANRATASEFQLYVTKGGQTWTQRLAPRLASYYAQNKSWKGAEALLQSGTRSGRNWEMGSSMMGGMRWQEWDWGPMMGWDMWSTMDLRFISYRRRRESHR